VPITGGPGEVAGAEADPLGTGTAVRHPWVISSRWAEMAAALVTLVHHSW